MPTESTYNTLARGLQAQIVQSCMDLFKSNNRGYGQGEFQGAKFNEDKQKWIPGSVRWSWGVTTAEHWHEHLAGIRLLGQGVLCDDGCCWYSCLDVDEYDIDYIEAMSRIRRSGLPLVVFRTKSGGLRIAVFFSEPIEADLVIPRMRRVASILGYAGCEIFPKQTKLDVEHGDCPSWIYVPFGGTHDMFPEQGCMTDNGGLMGLVEAIGYMKSKRLTKAQFLEMFAAEEAAKADGKANGRKHPKGAWIEEESEATTINTMFHDGPVCQWIIAHQGCTNMQNNFLLNAGTFCKKKYPENWQKALEWINYHVLKPVGDRDKLNEMIKRLSAKGYEYTCHDEPIKHHCNPHACRKMTYGVGSDNKGYVDLGLTILNCKPQMFFANIGDSRVLIEASALKNQAKFQELYLAYASYIPVTKKNEDYILFINKALEDAPVVEPPHVLRTHAIEIDTLARWLSIYIPTFLRTGERETDRARVRKEDKRIYMKDYALFDYCRMTNPSLEITMRKFLAEKGEHHKQGPGGFRGWWRSTTSIPSDIFDEETLEKWYNAEESDNDGPETE